MLMQRITLTTAIKKQFIYKKTPQKHSLISQIRILATQTITNKNFCNPSNHKEKFLQPKQSQIRILATQANLTGSFFLACSIAGSIKQKLAIDLESSASFVVLWLSDSASSN